MDLLISKIVVVFLFFLLTVLACLVPLLLKHCAGGNDIEKQFRVQSLLNGLNFVAGGIFIGTILLHLMPDVHDDLTNALAAYGVKSEYPIPEFFVAVGLLFFLLLEQSILACQANDCVDGDKVVSLRTAKDHGETTVLTKASTSSIKKYDTQAKDPSDNAASNSSVDEHTYQEPDDFLQTMSVLRSYALCIALSVHSIFEGMVVGFQDMPRTVWELFGAIIVHKMLVAFSFGSRLLTTRHSISTIHYVGLVGVFAVMCPVGCVVGTIMTTSSDSPGMNLTEAILVGLSTGSFIFVTFFEIIRFDGGRKENLLMCILVVMGFVAIALEILSHEHYHVEGQP